MDTENEYAAHNSAKEESKAALGSVAPDGFHDRRTSSPADTSVAPRNPIWDGSLNTTSQIIPSGQQIAIEWSRLSPDRLKIALEALEPQLQREHELTNSLLQRDTELRKAETKREVRLAELAQEEGNAKRAHELYTLGLKFGFAISGASLAAAVVMGILNHTWLASILSGPGALAMASIFVLRKNDKEASRALAKAIGKAKSPGDDPQ